MTSYATQPVSNRCLEIQGLTKRFGGLSAVSGLDMTIPKGGLYGLIGPNGAGKTTVFNMITGVYEPTTGHILFEDEEISGVEPHAIAGRGIARTFQNIRLFQNLSVLDNVRIAYNMHAGYSLWEAATRTGRFSGREKELTEQAIELLSVFRLQDRTQEIAKNLPYGEQRRLEIARALALNPRLLLLDEPAAGMNPTESEDLMELIRFIRGKFGLTILLIEHQMRVVMGICEWITVMDFGQVIERGTPQTIQNSAHVIEAYLGKMSIKGN